MFEVDVMGLDDGFVMMRLDLFIGGGTCTSPLVDVVLPPGFLRQHRRFLISILLPLTFFHHVFFHHVFFSGISSSSSYTSFFLTTIPLSRRQPLLPPKRQINPSLRPPHSYFILRYVLPLRFSLLRRPIVVAPMMRHDLPKSPPPQSQTPIQLKYGLLFIFRLGHKVHCIIARRKVEDSGGMLPHLAELSLGSE